LRLIWPWQDRQGRFSWLKASALALILVPAIRFTYQFATDEYGTLPVALGGMTYWSGVWATAILLLALAVTPAMSVLEWRGLAVVRRMIGVTALVYTIVHMVLYFGMRSWNFALIADDIVTRVTLMVATLSTIGLIALGATSLDAAIRSMGAASWQRLHNTNYLFSGLALYHVAVARGTYPEQYLLCGLFFWLMAWRVMDRYGLGRDLRALAILAVASGLFTALFEAGWMYGRRGFDIWETLVNNFNPVMLEIGIPATWQVLGFGLLFVAGAIARDLIRNRAGSRLEASEVGLNP
jgi:sulfoxide reductase heme-binding subunit YedZ